MKTTHKLLFQDARDLKELPSESVDLVVTSPPYPMIEMWDEMFSHQNSEIQDALTGGDGKQAYALMHEILDAVWDEVFRVLKNGRFACINIGDATRKVRDDFCLYPNHARILNYLLNIGFSALPDILWRKQANTPNKFMGSGMLPAGAYVTLEHEYILIVRKGSKREFKTEGEKQNRRESALFWEERNIWYSDVWTDIKGTEQKLPNAMSRLRSGAFPFELAYRLINMYSVKGDVVLDPFLGTGTTTKAAMTSGRNSIGVEIDASFQHVLRPMADLMVDFSNGYLSDRLQRHFAFVENRIQNAGALKYTNKHYGCPVVTSQEQFILLNGLKEVRTSKDNTFEVTYFLIQEFPGQTFEEWVIWYQEQYPDAIDNATDRIIAMIENLKTALPKIDRAMVRSWVEDLVLVKTFAGLKFQEAILKKLSEIKGCDYRLAEPHEESQGIDGFVGEEAYSIKPSTYEAIPTLAESIDVKMIFYEKKKDGIVFEIPEN